MQSHHGQALKIKILIKVICLLSWKKKKTCVCAHWLTKAPFISLNTTPLNTRGVFGSAGFSFSSLQPSCLHHLHTVIVKKNPNEMVNRKKSGLTLCKYEPWNSEIRNWQSRWIGQSNLLSEPIVKHRGRRKRPLFKWSAVYRRWRRVYLGTVPPGCPWCLRPPGGHFVNLKNKSSFANKEKGDTKVSALHSNDWINVKSRTHPPATNKKRNRPKKHFVGLWLGASSRVLPEILLPQTREENCIQVNGQEILEVLPVLRWEGIHGVVTGYGNTHNKHNDNHCVMKWK